MARMPQEPGGPDTLGFVSSDFSGFAKLPPLRAPGDATPVGAAGLVAEPGGDVLWFNEFWAKRLGRLTRVGP